MRPERTVRRRAPDEETVPGRPARRRALGVMAPSDPRGRLSFPKKNMFVLHAHILGKYVRPGRTFFFFERVPPGPSPDAHSSLRERPRPRRPAGTIAAPESITTRLSSGRFPSGGELAGQPERPLRRNPSGLGSPPGD